MLTKIIDPKEENSLSEIPQTIRVLFSFAKVNPDNTIERKHEWVKCRDFLGDVVWTNKYEKEMIIYGFKSSHIRIPLEADSTQFLLRFPSKKVYDTFLGNFEKIIHPVEQTNKLLITKVLQFEDPTSLDLVVVADPFWQSTIPSISLYTFLIKCCSYSYSDITNWMLELSKMTGVERNYVQQLTPKNIQKLLDNVAKVFLPFTTVTGYEKDEVLLNTHTIHDGCGFLSTFSMNRPNNSYSSRLWSIE